MTRSDIALALRDCERASDALYISWTNGDIKCFETAASEIQGAIDAARKQMKDDLYNAAMREGNLAHPNSS